MRRTLLLLPLCLALTGCKCRTAKYNECMDKGEHRTGKGVLVGCVQMIRGVIVFEEPDKEPFSPWIGMPVYDQDGVTRYPGSLLSCVTPDGRQTYSGNVTHGYKGGMSYLLPQEVLMERAKKNPPPPMRYHDKKDRMRDFGKPSSSDIVRARPLPPIPGPVKAIRFADWRGEERTQKDGRTVIRDVFNPVDKPSHEGLAQWGHKGMKFWLIEEKDVPAALWTLAEDEAFVACVRHLVEMDQSLVLDVGTVGAQLRIEAGKAVEVLSTRQTIGKEKTPYEMRHNPYQCLEDSLKGLEVGVGVGDGWIRVFFVWWR